MSSLAAPGGVRDLEWAWRASGVSAATARRAWFHRSKEVVGEGDVIVVDGRVEMDDVRQGTVLVAAWDETWGSVTRGRSTKSTRVSSEQDGNLKLEQERLRKCWCGGRVEGNEGAG